MEFCVCVYCICCLPRFSFWRSLSVSIPFLYLYLYLYIVSCLFLNLSLYFYFISFVPFLSIILCTIICRIYYIYMIAFVYLFYHFGGIHFNAGSRTQNYADYTYTCCINTCRAEASEHHYACVSEYTSKYKVRIIHNKRQYLPEGGG